MLAHDLRNLNITLTTEGLLRKGRPTRPLNCREVNAKLHGAAAALIAQLLEPNARALRQRMPPSSARPTLVARSARA